MTTIRVLGSDFEVESTDLGLLLDAFGSVSGARPASIEIKPPEGVEGQNAGSGNMLWVEGPDSTIVALKRCMNQPKFLDREVAVSRLRTVFGASDYRVLRRPGLILRVAGGPQTCGPIASWKDSDLIWIEFGKRNSRPNLNKLQASDIVDVPGFFSQFGEACAFNYLIGGTDRSRANFVYSIPEGRLISVDNEAPPFTDAAFSNPKEALTKVGDIAGKFLPNDAKSRDRSLARFGAGFDRMWSQVVSRMGLLASDESRDLKYLRIRLENDAVDAVLNQLEF